MQLLFSWFGDLCLFQQRLFALSSHPKQTCLLQVDQQCTEQGPACWPQEKSFFMFVLRKIYLAFFLSVFPLLHCDDVHIGVKLKEELGFGCPVSRVCIPINEENIMWKKMSV